jgi:hypothetical protein
MKQAFTLFPEIKVIKFFKFKLYITYTSSITYVMQNDPQVETVSVVYSKYIHLYC